jgi:hypothetical protein
MKPMSFPEARACLMAAGFRYLGTACIADCDTSYWAHPPTLTLATIRGWGDDYTPGRTPSTYDALVRVVIRMLGERQDFVPDETHERRAQDHLATLGFDQQPPASGTHQRHDMHTASTPCPVSVEPVALSTQVFPSDGGKAVLPAQLATHSGVEVAASKIERKQTARRRRVGKGRATPTATDAPPAPTQPRRRAKGLAPVPALPSASAS